MWIWSSELLRRECLGLCMTAYCWIGVDDGGLVAAWPGDRRVVVVMVTVGALVILVAKMGGY